MMRTRTALGSLVTAGAWAACLGLIVVVVARFVFWDQRVLIVGLDGIAPLLLLAAWPITAGAVFKKKRLLASVGVALVIAHGVVIAPELAAREPARGSVGDQYRLLLANVKIDTAQPAAIAALIRRTRPDVVVLVEAPEQLVTEVLDSDLAGATLAPVFPHRVQVDRQDPFALAVVSRFPVDGATVRYSGGRPVAVVMSVDGGRSRLVAAHAVAPVGSGREGWEADIAMIASASAEERPVPTVIAGDFNATWNHRPFRRLLDRGFIDAAAARGRPLDTTWPRNFRFLPPLLRIDHVLTSGGAEVVKIHSLDLAGSDHRALLAEVNVFGP